MPTRISILLPLRQRNARFATFILFYSLLLATPAVSNAADGAEPGQNKKPPEQSDYRIRPQSLDQALIEFSLASGIQVLAEGKLTQGMRSPGVSGQHSVQEALQKMLEGSGIGYRFTGPNTITLQRKPASTPGNPGSAILPAVHVTAQAGYDPDYIRDPYNEDYVLPNATAGTKTDTPIMETPLNVQVITKQVLKEQQAFTLADALKNISGVRTSFGGDLRNNQSIFLRGFDSNTFFRDGFRLTQGSASREFANVESVEVLKGSSAILYGLVEPGGMVNVITKKPLATPYYGFSQQFGSYDLYRTTLDATGPLTQNKDLLYRVNLSYENNATFRDLTGKENVFKG